MANDRTLLRMFSKARLPHRRDIIKLYGRTVMEHQQAPHKGNEKNWQTDLWLSGLLNPLFPLHSFSHGPGKKKKPPTAARACMSAQPESGGLPYRIICPPSRYGRGDNVTLDKC